MEQKTFNLEIKSVDDEGTFEGYASIFGATDSYNDVVEKGAFKKTLRENKKGFPLLWYHDPAQPVGLIEAGEEDEKGLKIKGRLNLAVNRASELHALMKQGVIKGLSIGYETIKDKLDGALRRLKELKLWEISLVVFQACPGALVSGVKMPFDELMGYVKSLEGMRTTERQKQSIHEAVKSLVSLVGGWEPLTIGEIDNTQESKNEPKDKDDKSIIHLLSMKTELEELNKSFGG